MQAGSGTKKEVVMKEAFDALKGLDDVAFESVSALTDGDSR